MVQPINRYYFIVSIPCIYDIFKVTICQFSGDLIAIFMRHERLVSFKELHRQFFFISFILEKLRSIGTVATGMV